MAYSASERTRRWRQHHPEYYRSDIVRRLNSAYKKRNREKVLAAGRKYAREHNGEYYQMNRDAVLARVKAYREKNVEVARLQSKILWHAKWDKLFGWELGTHRRLWTDAVTCAVCEVPFDDIPRLKKHTDHDHRTGTFRGIVHNQCNHILGLLHDSETHALQIAAYLRRHQ